MASAGTWRRAAFATLLAGVVAYALVPSQALLVAVEGSALALLAGRALICAAGPEERREGAGTRFDPQLAEVAANLDTVVSG